MRGRPVDELLAAAFDRASGRDPGDGVDLPGALLAFARRVVEAGRRVEALPRCPPKAFAKAQRLADARPARRPAAVLLRLLFDSWAGPAPAVRGAATARFLRFSAPSSRMDVELGADPAGGWRVRGTVDGPQGDLEVVVSGGEVRSLRAPVGAGGAFEVLVPAAAAPFTISVMSGRAMLLRTGRIHPARRG